MKTKICTSIKQSKKLLELGLNADTADMHYWTAWAGFVSKEKRDTPIVGLPLKDTIETYWIPAWSLTALINLMPEVIKREDKRHDEMAYVPSFARTISPGCVYYRRDNMDAMDRKFAIYGEDGKDLVDACFNMVVWLIEQSYIKIEK